MGIGSGRFSPKTRAPVTTFSQRPLPKNGPVDTDDAVPAFYFICDQNNDFRITSSEFTNSELVFAESENFPAKKIFSSLTLNLSNILC